MSYFFRTEYLFNTKIMNFSPFGGHYPSSIPVHQFPSAKFSHESNGTMNGISSQNVSVMTDESMVNSTNRYQNHYNPHPMPVKYQRDSSTQIGGSLVPVSSPTSQQTENVHHYTVYNHEAQDSLKRSQYQENMQHTEVKSEEKDENGQNDYTSIVQHQHQPGMPPSWQSIATPGSTVADYLSHLPASTLPISLHHFLKYSSETAGTKKDVETSMEPPLDHQQMQPQHEHMQQHEGHQLSPLSPSKLRKKKKKVIKEKKPRPKPGEIRLTTALDGSTLYCCPECHMAYPDKGLLEQHLLGHTMERRLDFKIVKFYLFQVQKPFF